MKKLIIAAIIAATLISASACSDEGSKKPAKTADATTAAVTTDPATIPKALTMDDINKVIADAKAEYASSTEVKLSDDTVISAAVKDPGITVEDVKNGTATKEQMNNCVVYIANTKKLILDRLTTAYTFGNHIRLDLEDTPVIDIIFLDPAADGFKNAGEAIHAMGGSEDEGMKIVSDCIYIEAQSALLFRKGSEKAELICPTVGDNELLIAIQQALDPAITETVTE